MSIFEGIPYSLGLLLKIIDWHGNHVFNITSYFLGKYFLQFDIRTKLSFEFIVGPTTPPPPPPRCKGACQIESQVYGITTYKCIAE